MLPEAELFVMAELMLVEVLGRIREPDEQVELPPMHPGSPRPVTMAQAVQDHLREDRLVPELLGGPPPPPDADVAQVAEAACAAARQVAEDGSSAQGLTAREFLLRSTLTRAFLAHYVAAYLGSTACPLPEELARPLSELTGPQAARWRELGWFRAPMPLPEHVSWRDRFLLDAGHEPHPLGHP